MRIAIAKSLLVILAMFSIANAETYLPLIVRGPALGQTIPPTALPEIPETRPRQPGYAIVYAEVTRYDSDAIKVVLLEPGNVSYVVYLDLLIKRNQEIINHQVRLNLGETREIFLDGGILAIWAVSDGSILLYQWKERADWTIIGTALWL